MAYRNGGARLYDGGLDEPGDAEADQDVKHVAPDSVAHRHVPYLYELEPIVHITVPKCRKNKYEIFNCFRHTIRIIQDTTIYSQVTK